MRDHASGRRGRRGNLLEREGTTFSRAVKRPKLTSGTAESRALPTLAITLLLATTFLPACSHRPRIVVGCKNFTEQVILGELIAQQIENKTHLPVERRFYLGGTYIAHQSLLAGRIDIYLEYTGTALTAVLKQPPAADRKAVYDRVKSEYEQRFHLTLGPPLGFNDTFAIEIRGEDARRLHLQTLSQARHCGAYAAALGTSSWSAPTATRAWSQPTACVSPLRRASWTSACSPALSKIIRLT